MTLAVAYLLLLWPAVQIADAQDKPAVSVIGSVQKPGTYLHESELTAGGVIDRAGGIVAGGDTQALRIVIIRAGKPPMTCMGTRETKVLAGDTINVTDSRPSTRLCPTK